MYPPWFFPFLFPRYDKHLVMDDHCLFLDLSASSVFFFFPLCSVRLFPLRSLLDESSLVLFLTVVATTLAHTAMMM